MKGEMALEYVFKVLIMLVTVAVIIGLIYTFSSDIRGAISKVIDWFKPDKKTTEEKTIEQDSFTAKEIAVYIESCLSTQEQIDEKDQKDVVCYTLLSKSTPPKFTATKSSVVENLPKEIKDKVTITTTFKRSYVVIEFKDLGNEIIVR
jgi:hypothetical protein